MAKIDFKPGNMLYPLPAVLVTVADKAGKPNIFTVAWAGTVCTNPPMVSISVRKERFSHAMLLDTGEFVINLTTEKLAYATDYCGVRMLICGKEAKANRQQSLLFRSKRNMVEMFISLCYTIIRI